MKKHKALWRVLVYDKWARLRLAVQAPAITTEQGGTQSARERAIAAEPLGKSALMLRALAPFCMPPVFGIEKYEY